MIAEHKRAHAAPCSPSGDGHQTHGRSFNDWFGWLARTMSHLAGKAGTFVIAVLLILAWAATGSLFNFSDTWQLIINTSTTIITFLMVFLIQNTQNRDTAALQIKLSELILAMHGAKNKLAAAEDMTEDELEQLHAEYQRRAADTLQQLEHRRSKTRRHH
jgi:low affinity Fe/Cu permease